MTEHNLITDIGGGTYMIDSGYMTDSYTAVYLIIDSGRVAVFDTSNSASTARLEKALEQLSISAADVDYVFVSHVHLDHSGGAGHYARVLPNARFICHPRAGEHLADPEQLITGARTLYGERFDRLYGEILAVPAARIETASDMQKFQLGKRTLTVLDTPGHTFHHISVLDSVADCCHTGDAFCVTLHADDAPAVCRIPSAPTQFSPQHWRQTVERLIKLGAARLTLAHFGVLSDDLPALAEQVYEELDAFVSLATQARASVADEEITSYLAERIKLRWLEKMPPLANEQAAEMLDNDVMLASSGLSLWARKHMQS